MKKLTPKKVGEWVAIWLLVLAVTVIAAGVIKFVFWLF